MLPGAERPEVQELPRIRERISFIYLEKAVVSRVDSAVTVKTADGTTAIPVASLGVLILGPGTSVTHSAIGLLADAGTSIVWAGENGVKYYAHGKPLTNSSLFVSAQAKAVSNVRSRIAIARRMYQMRFPGEDVSCLTMQQLRGREGARVRSIYRKYSAEYDVQWVGREYDHGNPYYGDVVNKSLSAANSCLYGIVHCVVVALGCSPALGFVHTGHEKSFVYDIADLYKAEITIPIAFKIAHDNPDNIWAETRKAVRDSVNAGQMMSRIANDIRSLLLDANETADVSENGGDELLLWGDGDEKVGSAISYGSKVNGM